MPLVPSYFKDLTIRPVLLHGDMWSGNVGELDDRPGKYITNSSNGRC